MPVETFGGEKRKRGKASPIVGMEAPPTHLGMQIMHMRSIRPITSVLAHQDEIGFKGVCFAEQSPLWFHLVGQFRPIDVADHLVRPERMDDPVGSQV